MKQQEKLIKILNIIREFPHQKAGFYAEKIDYDRSSMHAYIKVLTNKWYIDKHGLAPHTTYSISHKTQQEYIVEREDTWAPRTDSWFILTSYKDKKYIESFYKYLPDGSLLTGKEGLQKWAQQRWIDQLTTLQRFASIAHHIDTLRDDIWVLNATQDFHQWRRSKAIDELFYIDQYIYGEFGRWPLAELAFYAKLSQNKKLIQELIDRIMEPIMALIHEKKIDAIAFIPPSIDRKYQLLEIISTRLKPMQIPFVSLYKYFPNSIPIAQKTLKTKEQREQNAKSTIQISLETPSYNRVLLLDDFVWSGATLDITANKLKTRGIAKYVIGLALIGNLDLKYEVISEI